MGAAFLIAVKDLKQRFRDRSAVLVAFVVPLGLAFIFDLTLGGLSTSGAAFTYAVVDADGSTVSAIFVDQVLPAVESGGGIEIRKVDSEAEGRRLAEDGEVAATFVIPSGFGAAAQSGSAAELRVIGNVDQPTATQVARSIASAFATDLNSIRLAVATAVGGDPGSIDPSTAAALVERAGSVVDPLSVVDVTTTAKELDVTTYYAAGMAVFFLFFTVSFGVSGLLEERKEGTLARLLAAPIRKGSILGGKLLTSFLLGARWGSPLGVAMLTVAGVLAAIGVMALVATLAKTSEQANNWQSIIAIVLGLLGGVFFPISQAPGLISKLSLLTPQAWFMRGLGDLAGGGGPGVVLPSVGAMLLFAAVTGGIAMSRLDRMARL